MKFQWNKKIKLGIAIIIFGLMGLLSPWVISICATLLTADMSIVDSTYRVYKSISSDLEFLFSSLGMFAVFIGVFVFVVGVIEFE
jgi:uncharacterized membrane protein